MQPDFEKLDPELRAKIEKWQQNSPANQAVQAAQQASDALKEIQMLKGSMQPSMAIELKNIEENIAPIVDVLQSIRDKETPESPDISKPIIQALNKLESSLSKAVKSIDVKPNVKVDSPQVSVSSPDVNVDLRGVESVLKKDIPKAFEQAIKLIPKTEIPEKDDTDILEKLDTVVDWLKSIDATSRIKPQTPGVVKVTNVDGTPIAGGGGGGGALSTAAKGATTAGSPTSTSASADRQPLDVTLRDTSGNPVAVGGGTQYADGAARTTATGTLLMVDDGTNVQSALGTTAGVLKVDLSATTANGTAVKTDGSAVTQPVSGTFFQATQPVSATTLPLPTGAATSANQTTEISSLATIASNTVQVPSLVSTNNSSATPLGIAGVFTGTSEDVTNYSEMRITVFSDVASATDGLSIQQSINNTNWDVTDVYTIPANTGKTFVVPRQGRYFRIVYTNGGTAQATFRLQSLLNRTGTAPSSNRASDAYSNETDLVQNQTFPMVYNGTTWDRFRGDITNGLDVDVTRLPALVAGAATIGSIASITTGVVPGVTATSLGKAEDAAHASGDTGVMTLAVRNDNAATAVTSANGDYSQTSVDINGSGFVRDAPSNTASLASVAGSVTSVTLRAANAARRSLVIYNDSTSDMYIAYAATASTTAFTIYLPSLGTTTILGSEYAGLITGIWITATGSARITETSI